MHLSLQELTMYRTNKIAFFLTYSLKSFEKFYSLKSFPLSNSTTMIPGILFSQHLRCRLVWNPKQQAGLQPQWHTGFATWISSVFDKKKSWGSEKSHQQSHNNSKRVPNSSKEVQRQTQLLPHNKAVNSVCHQWINGLNLRSPSLSSDW